MSKTKKLQFPANYKNFRSYSTSTSTWPLPHDRSNVDNGTISAKAIDLNVSLPTQQFDRIVTRGYDHDWNIFSWRVVSIDLVGSLWIIFFSMRSFLKKIILLVLDRVRAVSVGVKILIDPVAHWLSWHLVGKQAVFASRLFEGFNFWFHIIAKIKV